MADTSVWFAENNAQNKINRIQNKYDEIVKKSAAIGDILTDYVCIQEKWNDENSELFGKWWNQGGKSGGDLQWNGKQLTIKMADSGTGAYDGEDRVKIIVQAAARIFWLAVCRPMVSLESSYHDAINTRYRKYLQVGKNEKYKNKFDDNNFKSTVWSDMMEDSFDAYTWANTTIGTKMMNGKSKQKELETMANKLSAQIALIRNAVDEFCTEINSVLNNTDGTQWWGFDEKSITPIKKSIKQIQNMSEKRLNDFADNTNEALSATMLQINTDISSLGELNSLLIKS